MRSVRDAVCGLFSRGTLPVEIQDQHGWTWRWVEFDAEHHMGSYQPTNGNPWALLAHRVRFEWGSVFTEAQYAGNTPRAAIA